MSGRLAAGLVLLVIGIVLAVWGFNDMNSFESEVADALNVEENNGQLILIGGAVIAVIGVILAATRGHTA